MHTVIFISLLALLFTYLETKNSMKNGMAWGFLLITIVGAIHYDYGNDYMSYYNLYREITSYTFDLYDVLNGYYYSEPGWAILCWLFKPIGGFFMMVAFLNIVQNLIVYQTINKYVEKSWWPLAIAIYLFSSNYYLLSFSMMRQELVMIIFMGIWPLISQRRWVISIMVLLICSFIHTSSIILVPFAFWGFIPMKNAKYVGIAYFLLLILLWRTQNTLNDIFNSIIGLSEDFSGYADSYDEGNTSLKIGVGFVVNMIPFVLSLFFLFSKKNSISENSKQLVALSAISFLVAPFAQIIQMISRVGIYFGIYNIIAIPLIYKNVSNKNLRLVLLSMYIVIMIYSYLNFFESPVWRKAYSDYKTIFPQL